MNWVIYGFRNMLGRSFRCLNCDAQFTQLFNEMGKNTNFEGRKKALEFRKKIRFFAFFQLQFRQIKAYS